MLNPSKIFAGSQGNSINIDSQHFSTIFYTIYGNFDISACCWNVCYLRVSDYVLEKINLSSSNVVQEVRLSSSE